MINLLSYDTKKQLRAARNNVRLRRYLFMAGLSVIGIGMVYGYGFWTIDQSKEAVVAENQRSLKYLEQYKEIKDTASDYRKNLAIAKQILGKEFVFSDFIIQIAQDLPPNTILSELALDTNARVSKNNTVKLNARAKSYNDGLNIKDALQKSKVFSNVSLASITTPENSSGLGGLFAKYPYEVVLNVTINMSAGVAR